MRSYRDVLSAGPVPFRFDAVEHRYFDLVGQQFPNISLMLERDGLGGSPFMDDQGRDRGHAVHALTAAYDLDALDLTSCVTPYRGYLLSHVKAMQMLKPEIVAVEEPRVHSRFRYGGRSDRVWIFDKRRAVCDEKTGEEEDAHPIQTALQAILEAERWDCDPVTLSRYCLYLRADGRARLIEHTRQRDFDRAYRIIRKVCG